MTTDTVHSVPTTKISVSNILAYGFLALGILVVLAFTWAFSLTLPLETDGTITATLYQY